MEEDKKERISEWFLKSRDEQKPFNKFIYLWISFNIFYGFTEFEVKGEENKINSFSKKKEFKDLFEKVIQGHKVYFFDFYHYLNEEKVHNKRFIKNLTRDGSPAKYVNIDSLEEYLDCCYKIRCNLFHGDKMEADAGDSALVTKINPSFEKFLEYLYAQNKILTKNSSPQ